MTQEEINYLKNQSMNWKHFSDNRSALGYDADLLNFMNYMGYDADLLNYHGNSAMGADGGMSMMAAPSATDQKALAAWLDKQVQAGAMTTFRLKIYYTPGPGLVHEEVNVTLFAGTFNQGVFAANGNLVFTNALGDTATIEGLTGNNLTGRVTMQQLMALYETEPVKLGFLRMRPKTIDQLGFPLGILKQSGYGAAIANSITPDDYNDPYQYQLTRVDVPLNITLSRREGFSWTIDQDQTGSGIGMTMFIPTTVDNTKALDGKNDIRVLNNGIVPKFGTPTVPSSINEVKALALNPRIQQVVNNPTIPRAMGQNLIADIIKGR